MSPVNPYESVAQPEKRETNRLRYVLTFATTVLYAFTALLVILLVYLPVRFPGLSDKNSGPAYYWPDDAFHIFLPITTVFVVVSTIVFCTRRFHQNR